LGLILDRKVGGEGGITLQEYKYTVKKFNDFPIPSRDVTITKLSVARNNLIIPGQKSVVSDIPAGDRKIANLFYSAGAYKTIT
jgi:hypothetical protein